MMGVDWALVMLVFSKEEHEGWCGVSAVVAECRVNVIGRHKVIFIFVVHVFPFHNPEESLALSVWVKGMVSSGVPVCW